MSFHENITLRKRQENQNKSDNYSDDNYETTTEEDSVTSIQNISTNDIPLVLELEEEIKNLKTQLDIANNEIDNLNEENYNLKKQISSNERKIKLLKSTRNSEVNCSNSSTPSLPKKKLRLLRQSIQDTPDKISSTPRYLSENEKNINEKSSELNTGNMTTQAASVNEKKCLNLNDIYCGNQEEKKAASISNTQKIKRNSNQILIIGDHMVKGLSAKLVDSRKKNWNDFYNTTAFVKPNATCTEIFSYVNVVLNKLVDNDRVVLSFGACDKNPYRVLSELSVILYKLKKIKVFILPVLNNKYVNTGLLNNLIYSTAKNYENCFFMSNNGSKYTYNLKNNHNINDILINNINRWIDTDDYKNTYINLNYLKDKTENTTKLTKNQRVNKEPRKGTIPFYFRQKNTEPLKVVFPNETESKNILNLNVALKKGTIPFYFQTTKAPKTFFRSKE